MKECKYCKMLIEISLCYHVPRCIKNPNYENNLKNFKASSEKRKGMKMSDEFRKKISEARKKYLKENPDKVSYLLFHSSRKESYPEKVFKETLERNNIIGWIKSFRSGLYTYDFAFPELGIDVEIDGATHKEPKVIEIDKRRDEYTNSIGWRVLRFPATNVIKNPQKCCEILINFIEETKDKIQNCEIFPEIILSKQEKLVKLQKIKDEKIEIKNKEIEIMKNAILNSGVDFSIPGWRKEIVKKLNISLCIILRIMKIYMKDFYLTCYKQKYSPPNSVNCKQLKIDAKIAKKKIKQELLEEFEKRKQCVLNSGINLYKGNFIRQVATLLNIPKSQAKRLCYNIKNDRSPCQ